MVVFDQQLTLPFIAFHDVRAQLCVKAWQTISATSGAPRGKLAHAFDQQLTLSSVGVNDVRAQLCV